MVLGTTKQLYEKNDKRRYMDIFKNISILQKSDPCIIIFTTGALHEISCYMYVEPSYIESASYLYIAD